MQPTRDLTDAVVAITGATAGIGRETARQLVGEGARVALGGRRSDRLEELVAELGADNAVGVPMDVRVPADNARLIAVAVDKWGRLDSVVPNAGIGLYGGILDQTHLRFFTRTSALRFFEQQGLKVQAEQADIEGRRSRLLDTLSFGLAREFSAYAYNFLLTKA